MNSLEISKSTAHIMVETIEYIPNSVVQKMIMNRSTGNICIMSFDSGQGIKERILSYDTLAQIIDGIAEITIEGNSQMLESGECMIIPAYLPNAFKANQRFKMILTSFKPPIPRKTSI